MKLSVIKPASNHLCHNCRKPGHYRNSCPIKKSSKQNLSLSSNHIRKSPSHVRYNPANHSQSLTQDYNYEWIPNIGIMPCRSRDHFGRPESQVESEHRHSSSQQTEPKVYSYTHLPVIASGFNRQTSNIGNHWSVA